MNADDSNPLQSSSSDEFHSPSLKLRRKQNTKRNIIWGLLCKLVVLLCPFVTRTYLIYRLGADYLGVNTLYVSILQVLSLAELGFATAVTYGMYKPVAEGDRCQVAAYLNYFKLVYRWVGLVILAAGLLLLPFLSLFVKGSWPENLNLQSAFLVYLANTVIGYFLFAYKQSLLNAYQRNDAVSRVNMVTTIIQCVIQLCVLAFYPNFYVYALVMPLCTVVGNLLTAWITGRLLPEYSERSLGREKLKPLERKAMRKRIAGLVFGQICSVSRNAFDSIFISTFLGLTLVACYGNYYVIMSGLFGILGVVITGMTAAVGNSVAVESREKNFRDLRLFVFIYAQASIVIASCLMSCYQPLMSLWVGDELVLPFEVPVLMVVYFYVLTMGDVRFVYVNATGIWWELRWRALTEAIANFVLNLILVQVLGLVGVILGTLISLFIINFIYGSHLVFKYYFGLERARLYYQDQLSYLGIAVIVCVVVYGVTSVIPDDGVLQLLLKAAIALMCSVVLLLLCFCWTKRFKRACSFVRKLASEKLRTS